jgi:hypothetical protein
VIQLHRHELPARPVRNGRLAPSRTGVGASLHQPIQRCACNALATPLPRPCDQGTRSNCAAERADIVDTRI